VFPMLCCATGCWARNATDFGGVPLCPPHVEAVLRSAPPIPPPSVVYYITRVDKPGLVKIGTTKNLKERLRELGTRGREVKLLATEPGDWKLERLRHLEFAPMRVEGEWFTFAAPILVHIHRLAG
jgi:T5orf172 domain